MKKINILALSVIAAQCHLSQGERLWQAGRRKEPLSEIAAPRGVGYLAEFHFLLDITFRIEHRKLCEVPILYVSISNIPNIARCFTTVGQHNVIFVSSVSFA